MIDPKNPGATVCPQILALQFDREANVGCIGEACAAFRWFVWDVGAERRHSLGTYGPKPEVEYECKNTVGFEDGALGLGASHTAR